MKKIKKVNIGSATMKIVEFLKKNIKGIEINEEGVTEIFKTIAMQTEENLEQIIAESLGIEIIESLNSEYDSGDEADGKKAVQWYVDNPYKFIQAYEDGYTIEPEQLYYIPLPHLETSDGIQQVLSKRSKNGRHYFASRPNDKLKQRYTQAELEQAYYDKNKINYERLENGY